MKLQSVGIEEYELQYENDEFTMQDGTYLVCEYGQWSLYHWENDRFIYANMPIKKVATVEPQRIFGPLPREA